MNITLRIPDELGKQAKHLAVDEGKSLSAVVTELLVERLKTAGQGGYRESRERAWAVMEEGWAGGGEKFDRGKLHSRD
jgi:hypothetical protein